MHGFILCGIKLCNISCPPPPLTTTTLEQGGEKEGLYG